MGYTWIYGYTGGYSWCKERMCVPSSYGRKRVNLLGFMDAVTLKTEKVTEEKYLNSDSVCKGLEKLRKEYPDEFIYVILDNAAYQKCKKVKHCAESFNINLVFLPPYSPNLNLIERLWKFLRKKSWQTNITALFQSFINSSASLLMNYIPPIFTSCVLLFLFNLSALIPLFLVSFTLEDSIMLT